MRIRIVPWCLFGLIVSSSSALGEGFKDKQRSFPRYRKALQDKSDEVKKLFTDRNLSYPPKGIFLRVFKKENVVELWSKTSSSTYTQIKSYPVCHASGELGPKRQQGDSQVPEGFYYIDRYNPWSSYHLSLGINYPNRSDRILGKRPLGGDIFIHGSCVSIGCVALTDDLIKEVYILAVEARNRGQRRVPVHIFPTRMNEEGMRSLAKLAEDQPGRFDFWKNLKVGYDYFENHRKIPQVHVDAKGNYRFR